MHLPREAIREVVAGKKITMQGHTYEPGDPVDVSKLPDYKVGQLLSQRILRPADDVPPVDDVVL